MSSSYSLQQHLVARRLLKVIAGIDNFDYDAVMAIARAAKAGGAQAVDIAADPALIQAVKSETGLIVFVSSVDPVRLIQAADAGADVLELGNFDAMYLNGEFPSAEQILGWARTVKEAVGERVPLCVTVSGRLPVNEQRDLAIALAHAGVNLLQTEGQVGPEANDVFSALSGAVQALGNTAEIRRVVDLPLLLAGGFTIETAPFAFAAGADALGVGAAISRLKDEAAMTAAVARFVEAIASVTAEGKGIAQVS